MTNNETTPEDLINAIMDEYGFNSRQELKESEVFQNAVRNTDTPREALHSLTRIEQDNITLDGWFLRTREFTDWNDEKETMEVTATGPVVLLPDGTRRSFANDQQLPNATPLSAVQIGPLTRRRNIVTGESSIKTPSSEIKVQANDHNESLPSVTLTENIQRCNELNDSNRSRNRIFGDTGDYPVPATLTIGNRDDIDWFAPGVSEYSPEGELAVRATDDDGNTVRTKLPIDQTQQTFGLADDDPQGEYEDALEGQRIFALGQVSVLYPRSRENVADPAAFDRFIELLDQEGYLTTYRQWRSDDGTQQPMQALDLTGHTDESGEPLKAILAEDLGFRVFDAQEERPGEWTLSVHANDIGKDPYMVVQESRGTRDDGSEWVYNPGAFVSFLSHEGIADENDPFAQAADMLDLDEDESEAEATAQDAGSVF